MKKLAYVLVVMFVAAMGTNTFAATGVIDNNETIVVVDIENDKKPCPADCKGECCKNKDAEAKADCSKKKEAKSCDKATKKKCCSSSKAAKTDTKEKAKE